METTMYEDNLCPDIGAYCIIRSTKEEKHLAGLGNDLFNTISGRWFEQTTFYFCCWHDEKCMLEVDETDIWRSHDKYPDKHTRTSFLSIYYAFDENTVDAVSVNLEERNGEITRTLSIGLPGFTREDISRCKEIMMAWHNTGIIEITNCRIDTNEIPWKKVVGNFYFAFLSKIEHSFLQLSSC